MYKCWSSFIRKFFKGNFVKSHRNDNQRFYNNLIINSLEELRQLGKEYLKRSNKIPMAIIDYKSPVQKRNEILFNIKFLQ